MPTAIPRKSDNFLMSPLSSANTNDYPLNIDENPILKSERPRSTGLTSALLQSSNNYQKSNLSPDKSDASFDIHILKHNLAAVDALLTHPDLKDDQQLSDEIKDIANSYNEKCAQAGLSQFAISNKKNDIAGQIGDVIGKVKEDYYDVFEGALAKYIEFYKKFTEEIVARMGGYIHSVKDEGQLKYDFEKLYIRLTALIVEYEKEEDSKLYPTDGSLLTQEQAQSWAKDMGLPQGSIKWSQSNTGYYISIDLTPLRSMFDNIIYYADDKQLYNTEYQAWLTGFNAQEDQMKTTVQSLTGRFGNANAVYDNMVKILASTISTLAEMVKRYFSF